VDQNIRTAQTQFYSLSLDQQIGHSVVELTYNGARGIHLYDIKNYNIPGSGNFYLGDPIKDPVSGNSALTYVNPQYTNDNNRGSNGDSYYQAANLQFTTQDIHHTGLSLVANYTVAHATDDLSTTFSETSAGLQHSSLHALYASHTTYLQVDSEGRDRRRSQQLSDRRTAYSSSDL